jgi:hypothetical protein
MPNSHKVYIEFWGRPKDKKYIKDKEIKLENYKKLGIIDQIISLDPKHLSDLDSYLGRFLSRVANLQVR